VDRDNEMTSNRENEKRRRRAAPSPNKWQGQEEDSIEGNIIINKCKNNTVLLKHNTQF
jgi:hypothetical protein